MEQNCGATACIGQCSKQADLAGAGSGTPPTIQASARRMLAISSAYLFGGTVCQAAPPSRRPA